MHCDTSFVWILRRKSGRLNQIYYMVNKEPVEECCVVMTHDIFHSWINSLEGLTIVSIHAPEGL